MLSPLGGPFMNIRIRFFLLIVYVAVSLALIILFRGYSSTGSMQSLFILTSWSVIIYVLLSLSSLPLFLMLFVLYLFVLLFLDNCLKQKPLFRLPLIPLLIHSVGVAICFLIPGRDEAGGGFITNLFAWVIPIVVASLYLFFEWRLAQEGRKPEHASP